MTALVVMYVLGLPIMYVSLKENNLPVSHAFLWPGIALVMWAGFIGSLAIDAWDRMKGDKT